MNYYKRHLGDYAKDTGHLSALEHGVYTLMLDRYYSTERPIPQREAYKVARAATKPEREAVDAVLSEYFKLDGDGWRHSYADRVIEAHKRQAEINRETGRKGGRPPNSAKAPQGTEPNQIENKTDSVPENNRIGFVSVSDSVPENNPSHKPLAISQEKAESKASPRKRGCHLPDGFSATAAHKSLALELGVSLPTEIANFCDHHRAKGSTFVDWDAALRTWLRRSKSYAKPQAPERAELGTIPRGVYF